MRAICGRALCGILILIACHWPEICRAESDIVLASGRVDVDLPTPISQMRYEKVEAFAFFLSYCTQLSCPNIVYRTGNLTALEPALFLMQKNWTLNDTGVSISANQNARSSLHQQQLFQYFVKRWTNGEPDAAPGLFWGAVPYPGHIPGYNYFNYNKTVLFFPCVANIGARVDFSGSTITDIVLTLEKIDNPMPGELPPVAAFRIDVIGSASSPLPRYYHSESLKRVTQLDVLSKERAQPIVSSQRDPKPPNSTMLALGYATARHSNQIYQALYNFSAPGAPGQYVLGFGYRDDPDWFGWGATVDPDNQLYYYIQPGLLDMSDPILWRVNYGSNTSHGTYTRYMGANPAGRSGCLSFDRTTKKLYMLSSRQADLVYIVIWDIYSKTPSPQYIKIEGFKLLRPDMCAFFPSNNKAGLGTSQPGFLFYATPNTTSAGCSAYMQLQAFEASSGKHVGVVDIPHEMSWYPPYMSDYWRYSSPTARPVYDDKRGILLMLNFSGSELVIVSPLEHKYTVQYNLTSSAFAAGANNNGASLDEEHGLYMYGFGSPQAATQFETVWDYVNQVRYYSAYIYGVSLHAVIFA